MEDYQKFDKINVSSLLIFNDNCVRGGAFDGMISKLAVA